ncbi:MAG: saccharopine dehydrogenase NADP-binding domain-containing protein [Pseudomonadota bacterium]
MKKREFDVIILGATGFTGRLVAEHLLATYGVSGSLRWAIAGRNPEKLGQIKQALGPGADALPIIVAESHDADSICALVKRTQVVASTVGPYSIHGNELVAACARFGTHYCDLAGEVPWIRRMIDAHSGVAKRSGAVLVNCCGFDSIPSDIGVWFMQREAQERFGQPLQKIHFCVEDFSGGLSGGTAASMMEVIEEARGDRRCARLLMNPYSLNPRNNASGLDQRDAVGFGHDEILDTWVAPFLMAGINTRIVRRSNALLGNAYGKDFRYAEYLGTGSGPTGLLKAAAVSGAMATLFVSAAFAPTRALLKRFALPSPGEGPNEKERNDGFYRIVLAGMDAEGRVLRGEVTGDRDPGYGSTSRMLGEAAVCLSNLDTDTEKTPGGFLTPAAAMGDALLDRLQRNAGLGFEIKSQLD